MRLEESLIEWGTLRIASREILRVVVSLVVTGSG